MCVAPANRACSCHSTCPPEAVGGAQARQALTARSRRGQGPSPGAASGPGERRAQWVLWFAASDRGQGGDWRPFRGRIKRRGHAQHPAQQGALNNHLPPRLSPLPPRLQKPPPGLLRLGALAEARAARQLHHTAPTARCGRGAAAHPALAPISPGSDAGEGERAGEAARGDPSGAGCQQPRRPPPRPPRPSPSPWQLSAVVGWRRMERSGAPAAGPPYQQLPPVAAALPAG